MGVCPSGSRGAGGRVVSNEHDARDSADSRDDLIFGKNAVLSFLEQNQLEPDTDHKKVQEALLTDTMEKARRAIANDDIAELEKEIQAAVQDLRQQTANGLKLPARSHLTPGSGIKVTKILLANAMEHDSRVQKIKSLARQLHIPVQAVDRKKLDQIAGPQRRHQGVLAMISSAELWKLDTFLQKLILDRIDRELAGETMDGYMLALLDGVEDPHNLGAIIRVAEAAGVKALFLPQRRAAGLTGTVAKTSAGALATLPVVRVGNIVQCLETLKKYGFWVAALDLDGKELYTESNLMRPLVIVIGSEGSGVSRLVKEHCDLLLKIPMLGKTESLNASVAAGIMFYEVVRQSGKGKS